MTTPPRLWDVATGEELHTLAGHTDSVISAAFSPDGKLVVTASMTTPPRCGTRRRVRSCTPWPATRIRSTRPPSARTASWWRRPADDNTARVWDVATGEELHTLAGHTGRSTRRCFSPDGKLVVTASRDNTAKVWDVATGKELHTLAGHTAPVCSAAFSPELEVHPKRQRSPATATAGHGQRRQHCQGVGRGDG